MPSIGDLTKYSLYTFATMLQLSVIANVMTIHSAEDPEIDNVPLAGFLMSKTNLTNVTTIALGIFAGYSLCNGLRTTKHKIKECISGGWEGIKFFRVAVPLFIVLSTISNYLCSSVILCKENKPVNEDNDLLSLSQKIFYTTIIGPIFEEIAFRGVIAGTTKYIAKKIPGISNKAEAISQGVSSIWFGLMHPSWATKINSSVSGWKLLYPIKKEHGMMGAISAHIAFNTISAFIISPILNEYYIKKFF
ncbi:MAG: hypothetical protein K1000chlam3_01237 [Chlamydiae bacterium]|nr:hypothetical protein [Chlamydiota bacterium]